jgi:hypothetical protein
VTIESQVQALQALIDNLAKAVTLRDKIRLADRIYEALGECERLVDKFISETVGAENSGRKSMADAAGEKENPEPPLRREVAERREPSGYREPSPKQFRGMKLADIGRMLLKDRGVLHGSEIERLAKAGGFKSSARTFQPYLSVAFKREGGFENIGKNRWKLNESVPPGDRADEEGQSAVKGATVKVSAGTVVTSAKMKLHEWLKENGPAGVGEAARGAGLPTGTVSSYLSVQKRLFEKRDGKWHAL